MKKWIRYMGVHLAICICVFGLAGCGLDLEGEADRQELEFTVVEPEAVPAELKKVLEKHKAEEMKIVFIDQGSLYAVRGYGEQESGGYSIAVDECAEGKEKIYIATTLIGPAETERAAMAPSYPVIVLKMEERDKEVEFD